jgi:hypothetical protein
MIITVRVLLLLRPLLATATATIIVTTMDMDIIMTNRSKQSTRDAAAAREQ